MSESKKIKGSDLIAPGFLTDSIEQAEKFLKVIKETKTVIIETNKVTSKKLKEASKGSTLKDLKEANKLMDESIKQRTLVVKAEEAEITAQNKLNKAKDLAIAIEKKKIAITEKEQKAIERQNSAYAQASDRLNKLRKEYKDLAIAGKGAEVATHNMLMEIQKLDKELKKIDADVGQFNRSVGDYKNQMKGAIEETELLTEGMGKLGEQQNQIIQGFVGMTNQLKALKQGQDEATTSASKLGRTMKAIGIVAILTAIASVFAFFTSSRKGALEFDLILNRIKATISILIGSLAKWGEGLIVQFKSWGASLRGIQEDIKQFFTNPLQKSKKAQEEYALAAKLSAEATEIWSKSFEGNVEKIDSQTDAINELTLAIFKYEDELRKMQISLNDAKMDEEDYNEILADGTISLNEQKAALEGGITARLKQAQIQKQIAKTEYENAVRQVKIDLRGNHVSEEKIALIEKEGYQAFLNSELAVEISDATLNTIQEKFIAEKTAIDALDDLKRQEAERRRQIAQDEIINNIELIRSKKLGSDEEVKILTKQVADEKFQLKEREIFQNTLREKQLEARNEEVRLLTKFGLEEQEIRDLMNEKDQVALANSLKELRATKLSQAATDELAKVIFEAQTSDLEYQEQIAKFEEERIKREEKLLSLQKEINIINQQSVLDEVQKIENEKLKILEESNQKILQQNNAFNKKLATDRRKASEDTLAVVEAEFEIRNDIAQKQLELDQKNIKNSVNDELVREKELEKLQATFDANQAKMQIEQSEKIAALKQKEIDQLKSIELRRTEIVVENLQKATEALSSELDKRQQMESDKASKNIDKQTAAIEKQQDLAARGLENTLAFQEAQMEKALLKQQDLERKQAKEKENIALAEALLNAYNAELKQPNANPLTAAAKALGDVLLFKGLAAGLVQFAADGNDDVNGPGTTTSDSIPFMLSKHEGVVKATANMDNPGVVSALNNDTFDQLYMPKYDLSQDVNTGSTGHNFANSLLLQGNNEIIGLLEEIRNKPVQQIDVDKFGNLLETVYKNGMKTVTKHKNKRSIG